MPSISRCFRGISSRKFISFLSEMMSLIIGHLSFYSFLNSSLKLFWTVWIFEFLNSQTRSLNARERSRISVAFQALRSSRLVCWRMVRGTLRILSPSLSVASPLVSRERTLANKNCLSSNKLNGTSRQIKRCRLSEPAVSLVYRACSVLSELTPDAQ